MRGLLGVAAEERQRAELDPQAAVADVVVHVGRQRVLGPFGAERALEVGVFDERDRRVRAAERGSVLGNPREQRVHLVGERELARRLHLGPRGRVGAVLARRDEDAAGHGRDRQRERDPRPRREPAPLALRAHRRRRRPLRANAFSLRHEPIVRADRARAAAARNARATLDVRSHGEPTRTLSPVSADVRPAARLPQAVPLVARRLDRARGRLDGGLARDAVGDRRRDRQRAPAGGSPGAGVARRADRRPRPRPRGDDGRPAADRGPPVARRRVRPAQRALLAHAAPLLELLRPAPDRPAHVARDGGSPGGPLLPRLRPHLLRPAHPHRGRRRRDPLPLRRGDRADRARDHAAPRRDRLPVLARVTPDPQGRAAAHGGHDDRRRGEHRRRERRQGVRAGAARGEEVLRPQRGRVHPVDRGDAAARDLRAAALVPPAADAGRRAARRRPPRHRRRPRAGRTSSRSTSTC